MPCFTRRTLRWHSHSALVHDVACGSASLYVSNHGPTFSLRSCNSKTIWLISVIQTLLEIFCKVQGSNCVLKSSGTMGSLTSRKPAILFCFEIFAFSALVDGITFSPIFLRQFLCILGGGGLMRYFCFWVSVLTICRPLILFASDCTSQDVFF